jgi:hypothetical protein
LILLLGWDWKRGLWVGEEGKKRVRRYEDGPNVVRKSTDVRDFEVSGSLAFPKNPMGSITVPTIEIKNPHSSRLSVPCKSGDNFEKRSTF